MWFTKLEKTFIPLKMRVIYDPKLSLLIEKIYISRIIFEQISLQTLL